MTCFKMDKIGYMINKKERSHMLSTISKTFSKPKGWLGSIAGFIMANENKALNQWAIQHLDLSDGENILKSAMGPATASSSICLSIMKISTLMDWMLPPPCGASTVPRQ
ncbi:hypothetical protein ACEQPO_03145 [Bacillus sp. SL00103]